MRPDSSAPPGQGIGVSHELRQEEDRSHEISDQKEADFVTDPLGRHSIVSKTAGNTAKAKSVNLTRTSTQTIAKKGVEQLVSITETEDHKIEKGETKALSAQEVIERHASLAARDDFEEYVLKQMSVAHEGQLQDMKQWFIDFITHPDVAISALMEDAENEDNAEAISHPGAAPPEYPVKESQLRPTIQMVVSPRRTPGMFSRLAGWVNWFLTCTVGKSEKPFLCSQKNQGRPNGLNTPLRLPITTKRRKVV
ncbi:MAG: hypothetical protein Q9223_003894 [Gallowayella weberi]